MTAYKPIFLRPIEITSSNNSCEMKLYDVGLAGVKTAAVSVTTGVYGSIVNLASAIASAITTEFTDWTVTAELVQGTGSKSDDLFIKWSFADNEESGTEPDTKWNELYDIVGSTASGYTNESFLENPQHTYSQTMTYRPSHIWIPTYQVANQSRFFISQPESYVGDMAKSGFLHGNRSGPTIYYRDMYFVNEKAENVYAEAITNARKENRTWEYFATECRAVGITDAGNPCAKGFYFVPDWNDIIAECEETHSDNGDVNFDLTVSPDEYVFCQMGEKGGPEPQASTPTGKAYYSISFPMHTVDYSVSWTYPE